jgi:hypothetical protein
MTAENLAPAYVALNMSNDQWETAVAQLSGDKRPNRDSSYVASETTGSDGDSSADVVARYAAVPWQETNHFGWAVVALADESHRDDDVAVEWANRGGWWERASVWSTGST